MQQDNQMLLYVIDFVKTGNHSCFLKVAGYDAKGKHDFDGEIKFVRGEPFGDLIHPERSHLTQACQEYVRVNLIERFKKGEFE